MFDYDVKFVYEYSYIGITVIARDDEEAVTSAWDILADQEITAPEPQECQPQHVNDTKPHESTQPQT